MIVLSLFDGISCGRVALDRAGIKVDKYYASELDKYAIKIAQKNYPDTVEIGDVKEVKAENLPQIDLLMGGSPCQDLSIAKQNREGLNGARSGLFWEYVRLLRTCKPKYFLLENVASMPKQAKTIITRELGVEPILINSALVSAQQRKRLYWTNIPNIFQPLDKGILLKDILETGISTSNKSSCLDSNYWKTLGKQVFNNHARGNRQLVYEGLYSPHDEILRTEKSAALGTKVGSFRNRTNQLVTTPLRLGGLYGQTTRWGIYDKTGKSPTITASMGMGGGFIPMIPEKTYDTNGVYMVKDRQIVIRETTYKIDLPDGYYTIRKLTPVECERLQTLPDNYTAGISNTQRYKCLGNGWTVDVIAHIFSFLPVEFRKNWDEEKPKCANCHYALPMERTDKFYLCDYRDFGTEHKPSCTSWNNRCRLWVKKYQKREAKKK